MTDKEDPIWAAVLAAEDQFGEGAEDHARGEARMAVEAGDMPRAAVWDAAAHALHVLHAINRTWARPRKNVPAPVRQANMDGRE
ncbi:hypothetical protein [Sphingopyxis fribergensis]